MTGQSRVKPGKSGKSHLKIHVTWRYLLPSLWVLFSVILAGILLRQGVFTIYHVTCLIDQGPCPDYLQAELEKNLHQNLFTTPYDQAIAKVLRFQPDLSADPVQKTLAGEVQFSFHRSQPVFALQAGSPNGLLYLVNKAGVITDASSSSALPTIVLASANQIPHDLGVQLPASFSAQLQSFFAAADATHLDVTQIQLTGDNQLQIQLPSGQQAVVLLAQAPAALAKLQVLLQHLAQLPVKEPIRTIDLRFAYPVLRP